MFLDTNAIQRRQEAEQRIKATERALGMNGFTTCFSVLMSFKGLEAGLEDVRRTLV